MKALSTNRRDFLKHSTRAGILICSSQTAFTYAANEKLNIGAIGVGGQGGRNVEMLSQENIVAISEVDTKRGEKHLKGFPQAKHYTDFRRMLDEMEKEIDENDSLLFHALFNSHPNEDRKPNKPWHPHSIPFRVERSFLSSLTPLPFYPAPRIESVRLNARQKIEDSNHSLPQ